MTIFQKTLALSQCCGVIRRAVELSVSPIRGARRVVYKGRAERHPGFSHH